MIYMEIYCEFRVEWQNLLFLDNHSPKREQYKWSTVSQTPALIISGQQSGQDEYAFTSVANGAHPSDNE